MSNGDGEVRARRSEGERKPPTAPPERDAGAKPRRKPAAAKPERDAEAKPKTSARKGRSMTRRGGPVVAVTGAAHGLGEVLARRLAASAGVKKVIAIDTIRGDAADVTWRLADVREPALADRLSGVDVVAHLAVDANAAIERPDHRSTTVRGVATVLTAAAAAGVRHVVIVTSAMVYGAQADNPTPLPEDAELRAAPDSTLLGELLEMERLARQAPRTHPGLAVTVLRPAALVGPGVDTVVTRHFEAPRLLAVKGCSTRWQFCHVDDLMSAVELVVVEGIADDDTAAGGHVAAVVGCEGSLSRGDVERVTGKRHIELPSTVAFGTAERLHRIGATPASSSDLQFLVYPWVVGGVRLAARGWRPSVTNEAALRAALAESAGRHAIGGHRLGRRDAAAGAAVGATVALVGTAALVRRARRRRHA